MKRGILTQNGVHLQDHEWKTVALFLELGKDVELVVPTYGKNVNTADIQMDGIIWEMKAPFGGGKNTIRHNLERAKKQSRNIIIDLRQCKLPDDRAIKELKQGFDLSKRFRRMKIVTKTPEILDFSK